MRAYKRLLEGPKKARKQKERERRMEKEERMRAVRPHRLSGRERHSNNELRV